MNDTPQITGAPFRQIDYHQLFPKNRPDHPPRVLLLYGSLRKRSFSRLLAQEAAQVLTRLGATTKISNPAGLPQPDDCDVSHEKVQELREDIDTILEPRMVISMEPMLAIPDGQPGAGGYHGHDILFITEDGNENITGFPGGSAHNIIG